MQEWLLAAQPIHKNIGWTANGSDIPQCLLFAPVTWVFVITLTALSDCSVRFEVHWALSLLKFQVFKVVTPCSWVVPTFRRIVIRPSSGSRNRTRWKHSVPSKRRGLHSQRQGLASRKNWNFSNSYKLRCGMGGFHRAGVRDSGLLGCYTVQQSRQIRTFRRNAQLWLLV